MHTGGKPLKGVEVGQSGYQEEWDPGRDQLQGDSYGVISVSDSSLKVSVQFRSV